MTTKEILEGLTRIKAVLALTQELPLTVDESKKFTANSYKPIVSKKRDNASKKVSRLFVPAFEMKKKANTTSINVKVLPVKALREDKTKRKLRPTTTLDM